MNGEVLLPRDFSEEAILAWRAWRVAPEPAAASCGRVEYKLMSMHKWHVWEPRKRFEALCIESANIWTLKDGVVMPIYFRNYHNAPEENCKCGIYATKTEADLETYIESSAFRKAFHEHSPISEPLRQNTGYPVSYLAVGKVSLYGTVIECDSGWRAQYAYPYDVTVFTDNERIVSEIRQLYQIDARMHKLVRF